MAAFKTFPASYEESREAFIQDLETIQARWPSARLESREVSPEDVLSVEWIAADPTGSPQKALVLTCGIHGIEGYVGAGMRRLFLDQFLDRINQTTTGLYLVHAINPWGMKNMRRVSRNNIDLNRNFTQDPEDFQEAINPAYRYYDHILNPDRPLRTLELEKLGVVSSVVIELLKSGMTHLRNAVLQGQRSNLEGIFCAGRAYEPETQVMMDLLKGILSTYQDVLLLDMHTGYGPKFQMSILNSPQESRSTAQMQKDFQYPLVLKADPEDFYIMQGDMVNWLYDYQKATGFEGQFYAAAFEFGTIGENMLGEFISLWNMIFENQLHWQGTLTETTTARVKKTFQEMFFPSNLKWQKKALADCRQGLFGVLKGEGYI